MKKQLCIFALAIFGIFTTYAQQRGAFELGFGLGLNVSNVSTVDNENATKSLISVNVHTTGEYYFSDRWGLKAKLIYDTKGWADAFIFNMDTNSITTTNFKIQYLTLPIMANWHFGGRRNWYLNFGPYLGFLVKAKDSVLGMDLKESFTGTDIGIAFGIGHKFVLNDTTKLFIEYDAQSGFSDIFAQSELHTTVRNGRSSFNLGLLFNL